MAKNKKKEKIHHFFNMLGSFTLKLIVTIMFALMCLDLTFEDYTTFDWTVRAIAWVGNICGFFLLERFQYGDK